MPLIFTILVHHHLSHVFVLLMAHSFLSPLLDRSGTVVGVGRRHNGVYALDSLRLPSSPGLAHHCYTAVQSHHKWHHRLGHLCPSRMSALMRSGVLGAISPPSDVVCFGCKLGPGRFTAANAVMCSWLALGNILGYASGANGSWHRWFPFLNTRACCEACANLKGAFLIAVVFLLFCLSVSLFFAKEVPLERKTRMTTANEQKSGAIELVKSFRHLPPGMPPVLIVTFLTWLSWFPFFLYNNDWMSREIHHGDPEGTEAQRKAYENGIRDGSFGLLLNSIVLGISSFLLEPMCRKLTTRVVWAISNFILFFAFASMSIVSIWSTNDYSYGVKEVEQVNGRVRAVALLIFALLGFPLSVLFSVPAAVAAQLANIGGNGQGLSIGILNISVVIPQVIISVSAGPWDALFDKGNLPAFAVASIFAFISTFVAFFVLPKLTNIAH